MLDFVTIMVKPDPRRQKSSIIVYPNYIYGEHKDLMTRGGSFYAIWDDDNKKWSTNLMDVVRIIDNMLMDEYQYVKLDNPDKEVVVKLLKNDSNKMYRDLLQFFKNCPDNYHVLNQNIIFENQEPKREDYATVKLDYKISDTPINNYEELMDVLYSPIERQKIEWAIGSIITGASKRLQKFFVFYGGPGTGKSTVLNIIEEMFPYYHSTFDSKALGSSNSSFALEAFSDDPLVAIQHDGDFSKIEDNTRLNSIVAHESLMVNEKYKKQYEKKFNTILFIGTNKPVKITDAKSGILRRLIDINPTGNILERSRYNYIVDGIKYELGGIAYHCKEVFEKLGEKYYDKYKPVSMMSITNDFYNFMEDNYEFFMDNREKVTLSVVWNRYKEYTMDSNMKYPFSKRAFREELKNYFEDFKDRTAKERNVYITFKPNAVLNVFKSLENEEDNYIPEWLKLMSNRSLLDSELGDCQAQYASVNETPKQRWSEVKTTLAELDTTILHYVKPPENHIVIDFDLKNKDGEKDYILNLEAARGFPPTYAEVSKGGNGLHLHYIYEGDISNLSSLYDDNIEIKVFKGGSALRRKVSKCNEYPIAIISSGLPLKQKGGMPMLSEKTIKDERHLRSMIVKNLKKEIHGNTRESINFIHDLLEEAYYSGMVYDVEDLFPSIQAFANNSTNQSVACLEIVSRMHFKSENENENVEVEYEDDDIIFFDIEVFPNLLLVVWKKHGPDHECVEMYNPTPSEIEELTKKKLVGFNNRKYDNHILYARMMGYNNKAIFELSMDIVKNKRENVLFREAYNLSYTDILDFLSSSRKMSLKKWEIKLGIDHQEFSLPFDEPLSEDKWHLAAKYCCNDVMATEAVWDNNQGDWTARKILAELSGLTVNDTTNSHTKRIIVGRDKNPQDKFVYTDLSTIFPGYEFNEFGFPKEKYDQDAKTVKRKSYYRGEDPSEGGYVYACPGIWENVTVQDVVSMHPHSIKALNVFGPYTEKFYELVKVRVCIKEGRYDEAKKMMDGKLIPYLNDEEQAEALSGALKTAINSVYGLTSATFPNELRDPRNKDNIVAKYGALFMINLKHEVQERGFVVAHIKTDSIKIVNPDKDILDFVCEYGRKYGFEFDHETTYSKFCLVNDSTYIARVCWEKGKDVDYWTATGKEFQVPYIFKTLFSKEPIEFADLCETKSVTTQLYLNMVNDQTEEPNYHFVGKVGSFVPILPGRGGGILLRQDEKDKNKFQAVEGTKKPGKIPKGEIDTYFWLESEAVRLLNKEDDIDFGYWDEKVESAKQSIEKYGNFDAFISDDPMPIEMPWVINDVKSDEIPYNNYISLTERSN